MKTFTIEKNLEVNIGRVLEHLMNPHNSVVFIEVTNKALLTRFIEAENVYFIDPQHTWSGYADNIRECKDTPDMSAIKYAFIMNEELTYTFKPQGESLYVLEKHDMDSIGALVVLDWISRLETGESLILTPECRERIEGIDKVDCTPNPDTWNPEAIEEFSINWTNILGSAISDYSLPIERKVEIMQNYLNFGELPEEYLNKVEQEWDLLSKADIQTIEGVVTVTTQARGANRLIYKRAPLGIAYNPEMEIKGVKAPKFSIMKFNKDISVRLEEFFTHMNNTYPEECGTWGPIKPDVCAGGSPHGTSLSREVVAMELSKFI